MSPLSTPNAQDIIPETAHLAVQDLPSLAPTLPRASLAIVLLVAFSAGDYTRSLRDPAFWESDTGRLTTYSHGVLLAFTIVTALRVLLILLSALALWVFSRPRRPTASRLRSRFDSFSTSSPTETRPATPDAPTRPRDPADTQSPSKGWIAEADLKWEWRERGRNRLQDAFELCMIRRPRSTAGPASVHQSMANGWYGSPSRRGGHQAPLGQLKSEDVAENKENRGDHGDDVETVLSPTSADPFMRLDPARSRSTIRFAELPPAHLKADADSMPLPLAQARPESELEPVPRTPQQTARHSVNTPAGADHQASTSTLDPRSAFGRHAAARQSASSQDLFYTPMSRSPANEAISAPTPDQARRRNEVSSSPKSTPSGSYRRPSAPEPGPSTAGTSLTTLHALGGALSIQGTHEARDGPEGEANEMEGRKDLGGKDLGDKVPDPRISTETTSGESIADDSTALLSRSSSRSGHTANASHSSHTHTLTLPRTAPHSLSQSTSLSLLRASQLFRARSQSLVSQLQLRSRSGSLSIISAGGRTGFSVSDQGHVGQGGNSGQPTGSYTTLMERKKRGWDGDMSEFGVKPAEEKLGRNRATSVGVLRESRQRGRSES